ncbi:PREDICTED: uncharacterized protein LOC104772784 [Camelina sativa]|uniref:Uncharacterized protein LOC104772784 n=1 Tax=Camelina sativa TaxID=90675 RepID=A0ABM0Y545_CAMSA|nr:PREDICTED: uncharacterized protein LOC104772784 [Camelina sativa]
MPDKFDGKAGFKTWQNKMRYYLASMNMERHLTEDPPTLPQALETKYETDEHGMQKFSTTKFLNFKIVDSKPFMEQVEALQRIFQETDLEGMSICNVFKTNCLMGKLPPGWSNFKHYLNFKRKAMSLDDLIHRLRVEDNNRGAHSDAQNQGHDVHVAEHKAKYKGKGKGISIPHKPLKANLTEEDMVVVVTECNMVENNLVEWYYDTGATTHICSDRTMFTTYVHNKSNEQLFMGNKVMSKIEGKGKVVLKLTSDRELTLQNVKHVPDMRKNLISGTVLRKHGFPSILRLIS